MKFKRVPTIHTLLLVFLMLSEINLNGYPKDKIHQTPLNKYEICLAKNTAISSITNFRALIRSTYYSYGTKTTSDLLKIFIFMLCGSEKEIEENFVDRNNMLFRWGKNILNQKTPQEYCSKNQRMIKTQDEHSLIIGFFNYINHMRYAFGPQTTRQLLILFASNLNKTIKDAEDEFINGSNKIQEIGKEILLKARPNKLRLATPIMRKVLNFRRSML